MGFLDGGGFDWNGNGKSDSFDNYMDMKVSGSNSSVNDGMKSGTNSPLHYKKSSNSTENKELKGISMGSKTLYDASKDSNGITILKCILVTVLCIGGIVLPVAADMGMLGTLLCIFGGLGLSVLILKNV